MRWPKDRSFYIPKGSTKVSSIKAPDAVVYIKDSEFGKNRFQAVGFRGKAYKPTFNYVFNSEERRAAYVAQFFKNCEEINGRKEAAKEAKRNAGPHPFKVGDILYASWGYEQTNINFYQVVDLAGKSTVILREIAQDRNETGWLTGDTVAVKDAFTSEPFRKRASSDGYVKFESYKYARKWDGQPLRWSAYA